jgi:hypothetical protein
MVIFACLRACKHARAYAWGRYSCLSRIPRAPPSHFSPVMDLSRSVRLERENPNAKDISNVGQRLNEPLEPTSKLGGESLENLDLTAQAAAFATKVFAVESSRRVLPPRVNRGVPRERYDPSLAVPTKRRAMTKTRETFLEPIESGQVLPSVNPAVLPGELMPELEVNPPKEWEKEARLPYLHVHMDSKKREDWVKAYQEDETLRPRWDDKDSDASFWRPGRRYYKDQEGLLFFQDADFIPRLCVPKPKVAEILREAHESALEGAHAGLERMWNRLKELYYWPRMKKSLQVYCESCDVCQKTKNQNFAKFGYLKPNSIPARPYESVSLDLIGPLPESREGYTAILVIVDRMGKHAQFIPTYFSLNTQGFAYLFVRHVICRFGLPTTIYADRDGRWLSDFWTAIASYLKTKMVLSSARHPQHDGQTEIMNKQLEVMLRAYVADDWESWSEWLPMLEHSYNSTPHSSLKYSPYQLLYGFTPRGPLDFANPLSKRMEILRSNREDIDSFLEKLETRRQMARDALAQAQDKQARAYDASRRYREFEIGSLVLVNPHSLEWLESKGAGVKLRQRWIGPFEVLKRVSINSYRIKLPRSFPGSGVINVEHLQPYISSPPEFGKRQKLPDTRKFLQEGEDYDVEDILTHRYDKGRKAYVYRARFKGYSSLADKWLTARDLRDVSELLRAYQIRHNI